MKRKIMFISLIAMLVVVLTGTSAVFADDSGSTEASGTVRSMFDSMRDWVKNALDSGEITQEEAEKWEEHFDSMEGYHRQNGFTGHCGGTNRNNGSNGSGEAENQNYFPMNRGGMMGSTGII